MNTARLRSVFLSLVWLVCVGHCFIDNATAHWHTKASGETHHHHHPLDSKHQHENGEPTSGGHNHDLSGERCCGVEIRPSLKFSLEKPVILDAVVFLAQQIFDQGILLEVVEMQSLGRLEFRNADFQRKRRVQSLIVSNAPPSNSIRS